MYLTEVTESKFRVFLTMMRNLTSKLFSVIDSVKREELHSANKSSAQTGLHWKYEKLVSEEQYLEGKSKLFPSYCVQI